MVVNLKLTNAKVYDISVFDVVLGEKFSLQTDYTDQSYWFVNNDPVLSINAKELDVNGASADVEATALGTSIIQIQDDSFKEVKRITIKVVPEIVDPASNLNVSGGTPVAK